MTGGSTRRRRSRCLQGYRRVNRDRPAERFLSASSAKPRPGVFSACLCMRTLRRDLLLGAGLTVFFVAAVWAAFLVTSHAVNQLLHQDAEAEGEAWARYLAANVKDLDRSSPAPIPRAESMAFFEKAQKVGDVFLYKIFDSEGGLRLASDKLEEASASRRIDPRPQSGGRRGGAAGRNGGRGQGGHGAEPSRLLRGSLCSRRRERQDHRHRGGLCRPVGQARRLPGQDRRRGALARGDHRDRLRAAGARLLLAHAAEAAGRFARRVPRRTTTR